MGFNGDAIEFEGILGVLQQFADEDGITYQGDKTTYETALASDDLISTSTESERVEARYIIAEVERELYVNNDPVAAIKAAEDLFTGSTKTYYHDVVYGANISTTQSVLDNCEAAMKNQGICPLCGSIT